MCYLQWEFQKKHVFISINALKSLYEYDKIHELYTQHALIQDDPILLWSSTKCTI